MSKVEGMDMRKEIKTYLFAISPSQKVQRPQKFLVECYNCKQWWTQVARECPLVEGFNCRQKGHYSGDCPGAPRRQKPEHDVAEELLPACNGCTQLTLALTEERKRAP
jgi:hypothetical protein